MTSKESVDSVPPLRTGLGEGSSSKAEQRSSAARSKFLSASEASFIPSSVRREIEATGELPDAPSSELIQAVVLLADISGFTKLGEKLAAEHGEERGAEIFASQVSSAIGTLVNIVQRASGEVVKIAGDCLICVFAAIEGEDEDDDELPLGRAKVCSRALLDAIVRVSDGELDLHGGLQQGYVHRIHLKELKSSSPRTRSARQRLFALEEATMSRAELEMRRQRWFLIAGRPIKMAGVLLDKAPRGSILVFGGESITRTSNASSENVGGNADNDVFTTSKAVNDDASSIARSTSRLSKLGAQCPAIAGSYLPPIVRAKYGQMGHHIKNDSSNFDSEYRRVVVAFISLPGLHKQSTKPKGVDVNHLNDVYSALKTILTKFEGLMRDFLFEDKGCTMIVTWGTVSRSEFDHLRSVLFALEALAAMASLKEPCKIGISFGNCFTGVCGHDSRRDYVVMGTEVNMAARLMGMASDGKALCSEHIFKATNKQIGFDMTEPVVLKGREGDQRALVPFGKKIGNVKHKADEVLASAIFVGRKKEMTRLRAAAKRLKEHGEGAAFILEGLAGMGKSAIVQQFQRDVDNEGIRFLMGAGFAIEKQTPFFAFAQIICEAAGLSPSPSYGEILALKHQFDLDEEDVQALGLILPALLRSDLEIMASDGAHHDARAAQVCLKIFSQIDCAVFCFEDAHWIDSQSWVLMQMVLPQLKTRSIVMIVTRPPEISSILRGGGQAPGLGKEGEEVLEDSYLEEDDRVKFTRILKGLKERGEGKEIELLVLDPISKDATRELIAMSLGVPFDQSTHAVSDEFMKIIEDKAQGVPMYTRTFAAWLKEKNLVDRTDDGRLVFKGANSDVKFPSNLVDTVVERVDALDEDSKRLIKVCACFGFEFRLADLEKVAPAFLTSPDALAPALVELGNRLMVVPVLESRVTKHLKFTHQILCESAYGIMLSSQRSNVHEAIASHFENSKMKRELEVLAHHWMRAGNKSRACSLLLSAADKAIKIHALKEAVNMLSEALANTDSDIDKAMFLGIMAWCRNRCGATDIGGVMGVDGLKLLAKATGDNSLLPCDPNPTSLEAASRAWEAIPDGLPPEDGTMSHKDRAIVLCSLCVAMTIHIPFFGLKTPELLAKEYGLHDVMSPVGAASRCADYYFFKCTKMAYYGGLLEQYILPHLICNFKTRFLVDEDFVRKIYKKCQVWSKEEKIPPTIRALCVQSPAFWYTPVQPEHPRDSQKDLHDAFMLIRGNIKHAGDQMFLLVAMFVNQISLGNISMCEEVNEYMKAVRYDTEDLDSNKSQIDCFKLQNNGIYKFIKRDYTGVQETWLEIQQLAVKYPKLGMSAVAPSCILIFMTMLSKIAIDAHDLNTAHELAGKILNPMMWLGTIAGGNFVHAGSFYHLLVDPFLYLFDSARENNQVDYMTAYKPILILMRDHIESYQKKCPGSLRCGGQVVASRISRILGDRNNADELNKMENALQVAMELQVIPIDICMLMGEIGVCRGNAHMVDEAASRLSEIQHVNLATHFENLAVDVRSGRLKVDLVNDKKESTAGNCDAVTIKEMDMHIAELRALAQEADENGDEEAEDKFRKRLRELKRKKKELQSKIREKALGGEKGEANSENEAKIAALRKQIADARARADVAEEEGDEDAEDEARAEARKLKNELKALGGSLKLSRPKKVLNDAKIIDSAVNGPN